MSAPRQTGLVGGVSYCLGEMFGAIGSIFELFAGVLSGLADKARGDRVAVAFRKTPDFAEGAPPTPQRVIDAPPMAQAQVPHEPPPHEITANPIETRPDQRRNSAPTPTYGPPPPPPPHAPHSSSLASKRATFADDAPKVAPVETVQGRLTAFGKKQFGDGKGRSYESFFIEITRHSGERIERKGMELEHEMEISGARRGDTVTLLYFGRVAVAQLVGGKPAYRNRYQILTRQ